MSNETKSKPYIGRTTRLQYWILMLVFIIPSVIIEATSTDWPGLIVLLLLSIGIIHAHIGRWHDLGYSGWMTLLLFIPIVGFIASIFLAFFKGEQDDNRFGPTPYAEKFSEMSDA